MSDPSKTKKLIACPRCKFPNPGSAAACLQCKGKLGEAAGASAGAGAAGRGDTTRALRPEDVERLRQQAPPGAGTSAVGPAGAGKSAVGAPPGTSSPRLAPPGSAPADLEFFKAMAAAAAPTGTADPNRTLVGAQDPGAAARERLVTQRITRVDREAAAAAAPAPLQPPVSQVPRVDPADPRILAWLACDPFAPVPVGISPVLTLGRGGTCDLVLPHPGVSRTHAVVRLAGKDVLFEDRSSYGSYINGKRVQSAPLAEGDLLLIGPYEIHVRGAAWGRSHGRRDGEDTRPLTIGRDLNTGDAMSGRLEKQPLAEVLQALEFNKKTGTLEVVCGETQGTLVVYEGQPMFATFGRLRDAEAVFGMLGQKSGYYAFRKKIEAGERTLQTSITGLLLEASRRMDEGE